MDGKSHMILVQNASKLGLLNASRFDGGVHGYRVIVSSCTPPSNLETLSEKISDQLFKVRR